MSASLPDGLARELHGGVGAAARRSLPEDWPYSVDVLHTPEIQQALTDLYQVRKSAGLEASEVADYIKRLADRFSAGRPLLLAALFSAGTLPELVPGLGGRAAADAVDGWMGTCWIGEAAWEALHQPLTDPDYAAGDRELLYPIAARLRFLAFSEPMRYRAEAGSRWLPPDALPDDVPHVTRVFGTGSWHLLVGRCREARRAWMEYLDAYQSHLFLSEATPGEFEEELRLVLFRHQGGRAPLGLSVQEFAQPASLTGEDKAVIDEITDRHLLPRFDLRSAAALAAYDPSRAHRTARVLLGILAGLAGLAAVVCAALLWAHQATWIAVGCYLLIGAGVVTFGRSWAAPWLLRLPAAAAVGVIVLISFLPGGWLSTPHEGWAAVVALVAAACGYLAVEARNHGVAGWPLLRSLAVALIGAVHALMVSLIGLVAIAPAFVSNGSQLAALWHRPGYGHAGMVLLLATAWCLAVGVFSQILWDDRPITAPLAHMAWRTGR